jgi:branched-chain amino acid transport system ATP-binding protein/urea transport system ATP-binding protein
MTTAAIVRPVVAEALGVSMRFGGVTAVDRVTVRLRERELRCLIGPNGAGKSTFFKLLSGQIRPSEGEVWLKGSRSDRLEKFAIARLGVSIKTQVPSLMNGLPVAENLWLAAQARHTPAEAKERVAQLLDDLGLAAVHRQPAGALAHGQRQIVELGVAMAANPWLLLLDEPAGGLTHAEVEHMAQLVRRLAERITVVVVEHDMRFVRAIAQTITVFHQGRVLAEGSAEQVLSDERVRNVYLGRQAA